MSTRCTIKFTDEWGEGFYLYRHSDGYRDQVTLDIERAIKETAGRWGGSEIGCFVAMFLIINNKAEDRLPNYELTSCFHGDESVRLFVTWNKSLKKWEISDSIKEPVQ